MNNFSTYCANALQYFYRVSTIVLAIGFSFPLTAQNSSNEEVTIEIPKENSEKTKDAGEKSASGIGRRIQFLQINPIDMQFEFSKFKTVWIVTESQYKNFWAQNSKLSGAAPTLAVNWSTESLLAIFWESKDAIVRIPTFMGTEEVETNGSKNLRIIFGQNTPCFGIITSASPAMFLIVDKNLNDIDSISIRTETSKSTGCF